MSEGWICPKCGKVLAPWMPECSCYQTIKESNITNTWGTNIKTDKCSRICTHKTDFGYCRFTACVNPAYGGDPNYGIGNEA